MSFTRIGLVLALASPFHGCMGTADALLRVRGMIEEPASGSSSCDLTLISRSSRSGGDRQDRKVSRSFEETFAVHPWDGPYELSVFCAGERKATKTVPFRDVTHNPIDLGRIAL